jgi:hypothetical protein
MKFMTTKLFVTLFILVSSFVVLGEDRQIIQIDNNEKKTFTIIGDYNNALQNSASGNRLAEEVIVFQEDFEEDTPKPRWHNYTDSPTSSYRWGIESYMPHAGSKCLWCVGDNDTKNLTLDPSTDGYPGGIRTWAQFGPFNLHDAEAAILSFFAKLEWSNPNDLFFWGYSTNGKNYQGYSLNGDNVSNEWIPGDIVLPDSLLGNHTVWIGFLFISETASTKKGVFLDDVKITKQVLNAHHSEAEIFYDLGYTSNIVSWQESRKVAMRMNSGLKHRSKLLALRFYISTPTSFNPAVYSWGDGKPGKILWENQGYTDLVEGWNTINVAENDIYVDSTFVISFGYEDSQTSIGYNEIQGEQRSWIYTGIQWAIDPDPYTYCIHAIILPNNPPSQLEPLEPENLAKNQDLDLTLKWACIDADNDPLFYDIYLDANNPPLNKVESTQELQQYTINNLQYDMTYYWEIVAWDSMADSSHSAIFQFSTKLSPPEKPALVYPANNSAEEDTTLTLQWDYSGEYQDSLFFAIVLDTSETPITMIAPKVNEDHYNLKDLKFNSTYYWQVVANNGTDSTWSDIYQFTTKAPPNVPPRISLSSPADNASNQPIALRLHWSAVDDDGDDLQFDVYLDSINPPTTLIRQKTLADTANLVNLNSGQHYFWQVIAFDSEDSTNSNIYQFTTQENIPPNVPFLESPANNATNQPINLYLQWKGMDDDGDDLLFDVYLDTSYPPSTLIREKTAMDTVVLSNLNHDQHYFWKIVAWDAKDSTHSKTRQFTTKTGLSSSMQHTITGGTDDQSYKMISIPGLLDNKSPSILEQTFGEYDDTKWRFFQDNNESLEYPNTGPLEPGRAFWLISKDTETIEFGSGEYITLLEDFSLPIVNGWNQIGNPFYQSIDWNSIKNANLGANIQGPFFYESGYSELRTNFEAFDGCYIYVENLQNLIIPGPKKLSKNAACNNSPLANTDWFIQIMAECNGIKDNINYLGMGKSSKDGFDELEYREPPVMGDYISVYFDQDQWKNNSARYTTNFKESSSFGARWDFKISSSMDQEKISLKFSNVKSLPSHWTAILYDIKNGKKIDLVTNQSYTITNSKNINQEFAMLVGTEQFISDKKFIPELIPSNFQLFQNYPNPFNNSTTIKYNLPEATHATIDVFDMNGRLLEHLFEGEQKAGQHTITWNVNNQGSGVFFLKIITSSHSDCLKLLYVK